MEHHICQLPDTKALRYWHCRGCGWNWVVNPVVKRWFRDVPAEPTS